MGKTPGLAFKTLTPAVAPGTSAAPELAGITITIDDLGNVLLNHPGRDKNRNFTLDGHKSSVLTFAGIPLIPFDPILIDARAAEERDDGVDRLRRRPATARWEHFPRAVSLSSRCDAPVAFRSAAGSV